MKILDMPCTKGFMQLAQDGVDKGWHEMNGGNLSYRLTDDEARSVRAVCRRAASGWADIGETVPRLAGAFFMVTRTTGYMRNVRRAPAQAFGIVELDAAGARYRVWWGLEDGGRPTSEFPSHLRNHEVKMLQDPAYRVIYHAHPANLIALTFVVPLRDRDFSRALWQIMTECPVIFPKGVGVVPWMVPGKGEIAEATSALMAKYDIVVWAHHGLFCAGTTFDRAFGLMETVEKSAEIYLKVAATGRRRLSTITDAGIRKIIKAFGLADFSTAFLRAAVALLGLSAALTAGCALRPVGVGAPVENVSVSVAANQSLRDAVLLAANRCRWTPQTLSPDTVRCTLVQRAHQVVVDVVLAGDAFSIRGVSSNVPVARYDKWVLQLRREIARQAAR